MWKSSSWVNTYTRHGNIRLPSQFFLGKKTGLCRRSMLQSRYAETIRCDQYLIEKVKKWWLCVCFSGSRSSKTFKPKKNIPEGSHQYELLKHAEATLGSGNLRAAVMLPEGEDLNEWIAVNSECACLHACLINIMWNSLRDLYVRFSHFKVSVVNYCSCFKICDYPKLLI